MNEPRRDSAVAIDLELTGLGDRDEIIEVAAVRFRGDQVLETFSSFVRPTIELPLRVTQITGIHPADLVGAPPVSEVLDGLARFVGSSAVVGHSIIRHDLRTLQRFGLSFPGPAYDTFDLANILLPRAGRFGVAHLMAYLEITAPSHLHRALDDAKAHHLLFRALLGRAAHLDPELLASINYLGSKTPWPLAPFFRTAAELASRKSGLVDQDAGQIANGLATEAPSGGARKRAPGTQARSAGAAPEPIDRPLKASGSLRPIDGQRLEAILAPGGALGGQLAVSEDRPGQREMLHAVAEAFNDDEELLVEAGTGTGKSLAYLLPAAAWALTNSRPVIVSTHTLNLQEQLVANDIPLVSALLQATAQGSGLGGGLRAAELKGRDNYLCRSRLANLLRREAMTADEVASAAKILVWAQDTSTGARTELAMNPTDARVWRWVAADSEVCNHERCKYAARGECWVQHARAKAAAAHLVVVNHALLISDVLAEGRILPEYDRLIVDEAHHLMGVATDALGFEAGEARLKEAVTALGAQLRRAGILVAASALASGPANALQEALAVLRGQADAAIPTVTTLFKRVNEFLADESRAGNPADVRLTKSKRKEPGWQMVEYAWDEVRAPIDSLREGATRLVTSLGLVLDDLDATNLAKARQTRLELATELGGAEADGRPGTVLLSELASALRELNDIIDGLETIIARPSEADVTWVNRSPTGERHLLHRAPVEVAGTLRRDLFAEKRTVVLTSATLRVGDTFDLTRRELGLDDALERVVQSPFDYEANTLLVVATDLPDANQPSWSGPAGRVIEGACLAAEGRTLGLFTSYAKLKDIYHGIRSRLGQAGIAVIGQGIDGSRTNLIDALRDPDTHTVLLGTRSFWEGVDVPGEALSSVIITQIPFDVPTEPVFQARSERYEDPFGSYSVPRAITTFRQGFGRLIRRQGDRGVVVLLDSRVRTKSYGRRFLDALPPCQRVFVPGDQVPDVIRRFLAGANFRVEAEPMPVEDPLAYWPGR